MPRTKKPRALRRWTRDDLRQLKRLARKTSASAIARALKRSASAVRQKASALNISLRLR